MIVWRKAARRDRLDPAFVQDVEALLSPGPYTWYVVSGYRSLEEQARLWEIHQAGGPKAAPAGRSAHNYGLAIDVVLDSSDRDGLQPSWATNAEGWQWLANRSTNHPALVHGRLFGDWPHLERRGWKALITTAPTAA